ncbi:MAG: GH25 family lysozyme [Anaerolineae bacterium]
MPTISGIDVSYWQTTIDWNQVAAAGYRYAAIRATVGSDYVDPRFATNFDGAKRAGLLVTAYHVLRPKHTAAAQMDAFFTTMGGRKTDLPLALDVEMPDGATPDVITAITRQSCDLMTQRGGRKPILYTARWFWDRNVIASADWAQYDLWVASYGSASPLLPRDWTTWKIWQYTDKGVVPGVGAKSTDLNWFNGSLDELLTYAGVVPDPLNNAVSGTAARRLRARVGAQVVNIRTGPAIAYEDVGDLAPNTDVTILEFTGKQVWVKIHAAQERWCAFALDADPYIQLAPNDPTRGKTLYPLNVRSAPNTSAPILEQIPKDATIEIFDVRGQDVWLETEPGKWAALAYQDRVFMAVV